MYQTLLLGIAFFVSDYTGAEVFSTPFLSLPEVSKEQRIVEVDDEEEVLWLARIIFSETKFANEMRLVGWVVRNRVEAEYRGATYKEVARSPYQFSGLNPSDAQYTINVALGYEIKNESWEQALTIAKEIYFAKESRRPFGRDVLHFYSPVSATGTPEWVDSGTLDYVVRGAKTSIPRFAFYSGVR